MGYYIQGPPYDKAEYICENFGGEEINPPKWKDIPEGKALIVVIDNGFFEAAGYCYSEDEYNALAEPDGRYRWYVLMDKEMAEKLSGYK